MFDAMLGRAEAQPARLGQGAVISLGAHALAIGLVWFSPKATPRVHNEPEVVFVMPKPAPAPPLGGAVIQDKPRREPARKMTRKNAMVIAPDKQPPERSPEPRNEDPLADQNGDPEGAPDGQPGGQRGGTGEGGGSGTSPTALPALPPTPPPRPVVVPFDSAKMARPVLLSGAPPDYPSRARAARIEAAVLVQCLVTTQGTLQNCRVLKGHPLLDDAVLSALAGQRYRPAVYAGQPISVNYVFTFRFKLE